MMKLKRIEEPEVSPNGKWVLFAAVDVDLAANTRTPHVWVVPLNSSPETSEVPHPGPVLAGVGYGVGKAGSSTPLKNSQANPPASAGMTTNGEREIISDQDADRPRWAPDGMHFAFVSTKRDGSQIWIADFNDASGTVTGMHQLTHVATEAKGELWSPDGKNILFVSDVYPECDGTPAAETACNAKKLEEAKNSKVKAQIFTHLLYRHWNAYKEGKRSHLFLQAAPIAVSRTIVAGREFDRIQSAAPYPAIPLDLTPGDYDAPVFSLGGQGDYAFSPDGKELSYTSNHDAVPADSTNNDLFTVPVDWPADATSAQVIAATKDITADNKASDSTPLYSPDGKYIAYRAQVRPGYESDRFRLMLYERKTGEKKNLTENLDSWVGSFAWSPDSQRLLFGHESEGEAPVYSFDIGRPFNRTITVDGDLRETDEFNADVVIRDGYNDDLAVSPDGKTVVCTRMSVAFPTSIYETNADGTIQERLDHPPQALTHLNDSILSSIAMAPLDSFWFKASHGDKVEGFLVKPPNFDPNKKYPVKFLIHGGPEGNWGDDWSYRWNPELFAANGYVVVMINFHGSTGYGQKFIDAINGDWGGAPYE
ncbi:MAG TPA: prolyl oligopeptidase family serine peptidase, partial [Terriglobales bacterium]|nr:prolyl oligopeptidase family serine peptidase [Terriglobales bacterium]